MGSKGTCVGLGNAYTRLLGYVVIQVQVDGVWGYNEDQIALVIPDFSNFVARVPVILGMLHYWPSSKCNERGGDGCLSHAMGKCQDSTSPIGA